MPTPSWIPIIVGLAVASILGIAALTSLVKGEPIDLAVLALIAGGWGGGVWITASVIRAVDRRLWRSVPFRRLPLPGAPPVLHGTWKTDMTTNRCEGSEARDAPSVDYGYLVIHQRFSSISVRLLLPVGSSDPMVATLTKRPGGWELWYFYEFVPYESTEENPHRRGAARLRVCAQGRKLEGNYWNHLLWKGKIDSSHYVKHTFDDFESADAHFGPARSRHERSGRRPDARPQCGHRSRWRWDNDMDMAPEQAAGQLLALAAFLAFPAAQYVLLRHLARRDGQSTGASGARTASGQGRPARQSTS
jgi:SMODS-associating 2TM, beta-strand rich effector domain